MTQIIKEACPWCKSMSLEYNMSVTGKYCVQCNNCGAKGPTSYTSIHIAIEKWNMRAEKSIFEQVFGRDK